MVIKRIDFISCGKMLGVLYALVGLILGGLATLVSLAGVAVGGPDGGFTAMLFGVGAIIVLPIFYGVLGFIGGIIGAFLYNLVASFVGGIAIEVEMARTNPHE